MAEKRNTGPKTVGSILQDALSRLNLDRDLDDYRIWQGWDEVVGDLISRNAQPSRLDGSRLVVVVRSSTWMQELSLLQRELVERLNRWMGRQVISEIFLVVGKVPETSTAAGRRRREKSTARTRPATMRAADGPDDAETTPTADFDRSAMSDAIAEAFDSLWRTARSHRR